MKTLLEVCKGVYEIRRREWARNYNFTDHQVLELYGGTVIAAAKVMGYTFKSMTEMPARETRIPDEPSAEMQEEVADDAVEDLW